MIRVEVYENTDGSRPFEVWVENLPVAHAAKVDTAITRMSGGNRSGLKSVGEGVFEWRIDWGPGLRVYFGFDGTQLILLLGGGTKTRQNADIEAAKRHWADYKKRKKMEA